MSAQYHKTIKIPFAYSGETIPATIVRDIATPEIAQSWKHLGEISCHTHHYPELEIGLSKYIVIGHNIPSALLTGDSRKAAKAVEVNHSIIITENESHHRTSYHTRAVE